PARGPRPASSPRGCRCRWPSALPFLRVPARGPDRGLVLLLAVDGLAPALAAGGAGGGVLERHPAEERALDPDRVARHSLERDPVPQQFLVRLALAVHQPPERLGLVQGLAHGPAQDLLGH